MSEESPQPQPEAGTPAEPKLITEVNATDYMDVIHKYVLQGPQSTINVAMGSELLCAKPQPDGTIAVWARRPIDENAPMCEIGIWVFATGEPMPKGESLDYFDTCMIITAPSIVAPGAKPNVLVWHLFVLTETLMAGNVKIAV